jgi:hypothetical protein
MHGKADATFPGFRGVDLEPAGVEAGTAGSGIDLRLDPGNAETGDGKPFPPAEQFTD